MPTPVRVRLTFKQKQELIEKSMQKGFERKKALIEYGISAACLSRILNKQKDKVLSAIDHEVKGKNVPMVKPMFFLKDS